MTHGAVEARVTCKGMPSSYSLQFPSSLQDDTSLENVNEADAVVLQSLCPDTSTDCCQRDGAGGLTIVSSYVCSG